MHIDFCFRSKRRQGYGGGSNFNWGEFLSFSEFQHHMPKWDNALTDMKNHVFKVKTPEGQHPGSRDTYIDWLHKTILRLSHLFQISWAFALSYKSIFKTTIWLKVRFTACLKLPCFNHFLYLMGNFMNNVMA